MVFLSNGAYNNISSKISLTSNLPLHFSSLRTYHLINRGIFYELYLIKVQKFLRIESYHGNSCEWYLNMVLTGIP